MPLLKHAEGYRVRVARKQLKSSAHQAVANTTEVMKSRLPKVITSVATAEPVDTPNEEQPQVSKLASRCFEIEFRDRSWLINVELNDDPSESQWLSVTDVAPSLEKPRYIDIRVSLVHPFMVRFAQENSEDVEALLRVASAIAVAEVLARDSGVKKAGTVRRNINDILRDALSEP